MALLRQRLAPAALAMALAIAAGGCAGSEEGGGHPDYEAALAGSPPALARLHSQSDRLLPGGVGAYRRRVAALAGYPIVANVWASWCGPCRFEFPYFQRAAAKYGRRVAFLGVNSQDSNDAASTFLTEKPVPYPSYTDPKQDIAESIGVGRGLPDTVFYNRRGKLVHVKLGPYASQAELSADIRRYALSSTS